MIRLKVCGMRNPDNIMQAAACEPDYMGFIFYQNSSRFVGEEFELPRLAPALGRVGVFVNDTTDRILAKVLKYQLNFAQLHGHESVEQCQELRSHNVQVIKAFSVADSLDHALLRDYRHAADFYLFDTKGDANQFGGTGRKFDWTILRTYLEAVPYFLSGGIGVDDVADIVALQLPGLYAIDVNSAIEESPGKKDITRLRELKIRLNETA